MSQTSECVWHHTVCSLCPNTCRFPFHTICHSCSVAGNFKQRCEPKLCHLHATDLPVKYNIQSNCHRWKSSCKIISTLLLIRNKTFHTEPSIKTTIFCKLSTSVTKKKKRKEKKIPFGVIIHLLSYFICAFINLNSRLNVFIYSVTLFCFRAKKQALKVAEISAKARLCYPQG